MVLDDVKRPVSAGNAPTVGGRSVCDATVGGLAKPPPATWALNAFN